MNKVQLKLPKSWNQLTAPQLEAVAQILIDDARRYTLTGEYSRQQFLIKAFFAISGLEVTSLAMSDSSEELGVRSEELHLATDATPSEHIYYNCQYADEALRRKYQTHDGEIIPIRIYLTEIVSLALGDLTQRDIDQYLKRVEQAHRKYERELKKYEAQKEAQQQSGAAEQTTPHSSLLTPHLDLPAPPEPQGPLAWLLKPSTLTRVPYPELTLPAVDAETGRPLAGQTVTLTGPAELMQDFTWQQYRFASEMMTLLAQVENRLVRLQQRHAPLAQIERAEQDVQEVRCQWLATLYSAPVRHINRETGLEEVSPMFVTSQTVQNAPLFRTLPEARFQVISLYWQGMMHYLQGQFPKVFKSTKPDNAPADDNPFTLYTRSTTTMIKYAASNEEEVNRTTYTIILQHMQDMAEENERIEQMKSGK